MFNGKYLCLSTLKAQNCVENKLFSPRVPSSHIKSQLYIYLAYLPYLSVTFSTPKRGQPLLFTVGSGSITALSTLILQPIPSHWLFPLCLKPFPMATLEGQGCHVAQLHKAPLNHSLCEWCPLELNTVHLIE